jgi:hypothetical protein
MSRSLVVRCAGWQVAILAFAVGLLFAPMALSAALGDVLTVCHKGCRFTAIASALAAARTGDRIRIAPGTYAGGFTIRKGVTLIGARASRTKISGGGTVVSVAARASVTIARVTITGGVGSFGGGIRVGGKLTLKKSVVTGNIAAIDGGGIYNGGTLTLSESSVSGNNATGGNGGGIANGSGTQATGGTITLEKSTISDNTASQGGGGIENGGTLTLSQTTVSGNSAAGSGGIGNGGTATLESSVISNNKAGPGGGGGIKSGGKLMLTSTTVSGNTTSSYGGGLLLLGPGTATLQQSAVTGNIAAIDGGGIYNGGTLTLSESSVSSNVPDNCIGC